MMRGVDPMKTNVRDAEQTLSLLKNQIVLKVIFYEIVYLDIHLYNYSDKVWGFWIFFILYTFRQYLGMATHPDC